MSMGTNEKTTALIPFTLYQESLSSRGALANGFNDVGADGGQPFSNSTKHSIPEKGHKINSLKGNLDKIVYKTPLPAAERGGVPHYA
ncbi:MAG: hypothetical protein LUG57_05060 [Oscillospiraceae bacterium]|nr:hypothetical protein [Oscillospiraceae bacterium]